MHSNGNQPSKKLGVKYLDNVQMRNTFPDYDALIQRIKDQCEMLDSQDDAWQADNQQASAMYDNVYAILGGRGTGKSSVLLTLRHYLSQQCPSSIRFPIITPEIIGDKRCSILGWIMATAEPILDELENRIRIQGQRLGASFTGSGYESMNRLSQIDFFKDCGFQQSNQLRLLYEELCETIQSDPDFSRLAYEDAVSLRTADSRQQYRLRSKMDKFWNLLTRSWSASLRQCQEGRHGTALSEYGRPIVVLMFDDIDLVPERSMELLNTTFQFLSNMNVVIVLTAAERVLRQVISLKMFERMIGSNSHSLLQDYYLRRENLDSLNRLDPASQHSPVQMDTPEKMMTEFYNKVIPPANRYLLHRYNTIPERARYSYSSMSQSFVVPEEKQVSMPVDQFLEEQMLFLCRKAQGSRAKEGPKPVSHSFLQNTAGKTPRFRQAYLAMFGDKNRNIANGCLEIMNAAHRVVKIHRMDRDGNFILNREQRGRELEPTVRHLLQSLLLSKEELQPYNEEVDSLLYCIDCENMIYVDYMRALRLYQEECRSIRMQERTKKAEEQSDEAARSTLRRKLAAVKQRVGTLMVMLFFIENILLLFDRERGRVHGYRELTEILNSDLILDERSSRMHVKLFRNYQSAEEFLDESPLVLDSPANYTGFQLFNLQYAREYLQDIMGTWRGGRLKFIVRQASLDSEWVRTILLMGFTMYSGITLVNSSFLLNQTLPEDCKVLDMFEFGGRLNQAIIREAKAFLRRPNLFLHSRSQLDELKNIFTGKHIKNILDKMPDEDTRNRIGEVLKPLLGGSFPNIPDNLSDEDARDRVGEALKYLLDHHQLCGSAVYSTSDRYKQIEEALMKDPGFIEQYVALRWNMSNLHWVSVDRVDETGIWQAEPCLMLIRFIETLMEECSRQLKNAWNWDLILTDKEANDLEELLGEIDDFNYEIMRQNELIRTEISAALKRTPVLRETETYYRVSTDGLIKYLSNVYTELFEGLSADDEYLFVKMSNRQIYFDVLHYICFYESERVSRNIWGIPLTSMLVMDVKMLAFLQPYYLAARFGIAVSRLYKSERALLDPGADHRGLTSNEKRLRRWYVILSKGAGGRLEELCELLEEVRADAADQYYWDLTEGRQ